MNRLTPLAKDLRKNQTDAENILWFHLRNGRFEEIHFRRQMPIGKYIVDFVSRKQKLILELDGGQHNEEKAKIYDEERTACFEKLGYRVIRIWNNEIFDNLPGVLESLYISITSSPHPNLLHASQAGDLLSSDPFGEGTKERVNI